MKKLLILTCLITLIFGISYQTMATPDSWSYKTSMTYSNSMSGAAVYNGKIYNIGGWYNVNQVYDPVANSWEQKTGLLTGLRLSPGVITVGNRIYAIGGIYSTPYNEVEEYNPSNDTWTIRASMPTPRGALAVVAIDGKIYAIGGTNGTNALTTVEEYDPTNNTWTTKASMHIARSSFGAAVIMGKIYVVGGIDYATVTLSVEVYDPQKDTWTRKHDLPADAYGFSCATVNNKLYIMGGSLNSAVKEYDPRNDSWIDRANMATGVSYGAAAVVNGTIYVCGGYFVQAVVQAYTPILPGQIAFQSTRTGDNSPSNNEIYTMDPDGSNVSQLTDNTYYDGAPTWSATGTKLAFESLRDGNYEIYVMNADGTSQTNLTNNTASDRYPVWSPVSTDIAFQSNRSNSTYNIYIIKANGTGLTQLTTTGGTSPAWSPDGKMIAYVSSGQIYTMESNGTSQTRLTYSTSNNADPCWSPDGTKIVFTADSNGKKAIYIMNDDGSAPTQLTTNSSNDDWHPIWSLDGSQILFNSNRDTNTQIYIMNADGSNQTALMSNSYDDESATWSDIPIQAVTFTPQPGQWEMKASLNHGRSFAAAATANGKIYIFGGTDGGTNDSVEEYDPSSNTWTNKATMPHPRVYGTAATVDGKIYLFGNYVGGSNAVDVYNPATNNWTTKSDMPYWVEKPNAVTLNGKIYVLGGEDSYYRNTVVMYDPLTDTWTTKQHMLSARSHFGAAVAGGKIYAVGGRNSSGYLSSVEVYDPDNDTWTAMNGMATYNQQFAMTELDGLIYMLGGNNAIAFQQYDPVTDIWTTLPNMLVGEYDLAAVSLNGKIYALGGCSGADVEAYNPAYPAAFADAELDGVAPVVIVNDPKDTSLTNSYSIYVSGTVLDDSTSTVQVNQNSVTLDGENFGTTIAGTEGSNSITITATDGEENTTTITRHVTIDTISPAVFTPQATFTNWDTVNQPIISFSTTDSGSGMYAYEMKIDSGTWSNPVTSPQQLSTLSDGQHTIYIKAIDNAGNYRIGQVTVACATPPANLNSWTTKANLPTGRSALAAVTMDGYIYTIGGYGYGSNPTFGGELERYDPLYNTWTSLTALSVHRCYLGAAAVNGKIYAIGGQNQYGNPYAVDDTVEEYDPSNNTWTAKADMPTARNYLAVVALNNMIYAIGGYDGTNTLNTVERYDPSNNTWTSRASMNTARELLSVVALNGKIYALGGRNSGGPLDTVEVYNPSNNSWTTLTSTMPETRVQFTAVAAHGKIYIMGGDNGTTGYSTDLKIYDPLDDSWSTGTSMTNGRFDLAAVELNDKIYAVGGTDADYKNKLEEYTLPVSAWFNQDERDDEAPELTVVAPTDNSYATSTSIEVSGSVLDDSVTTVEVNQQSVTLVGNTFHTTVTGTTGSNEITITATDADSHTTTVTRTVTVDATPPATFTPTADPDDWTNINQPTITFSTTDSGSGIDHYEIRVGTSGSWTTPVTSPYQMSAMSDGEQIIQVKAVDAAGNERIENVTVYIDTTDPATPANFEAISGIDKAILKWDEDTENEVTSYQITRSPAFTQGSTITINRQGTDPLHQYIDTDVTDQESYSYSIVAVDHAGNESSSASYSESVTIGSATKTVASTGDTVVKFDECTLILPEGATSASNQVVVTYVPTGNVPANPAETSPVGPTYEFKLEDSSNNEIPAIFDEPVKLTIDYSSITIPTGYNDESLGVYWFDEVTQEWNMVNKASIDINKHTISVPLEHFTDYRILASESIAPTLQSYYDQGLSPYNSYFQDNVEAVSPNGSLELVATDLKLPGRNGMDLLIKRIYSSAEAYHSQYVCSKAAVKTFGNGWSLNIPMITRYLHDNLVLRLADGQTFEVIFNSNNIFKYDKGTHFILQRILSGGQYNYILTLNDGTIYNFDPIGRVTSETDPSGNDTIQYNYTSSYSNKLANIIDSVGREIDFTYASNGFISSIEVNNRVISYSYNSNDFLETVTDPMSRETTYSYTSFAVDHGCVFNMNSLGYDYTYTPNTVNSNQQIKRDNVYLVTGIDYPTGASSTYTFTNYSIGITNQGVLYNPTRYIVDLNKCGSQLLVTNQTIQNKITTYSYTMNAQNSNVPGNLFIYSCNVTEGSMVTSRYFKQVLKDQLVQAPIITRWGEDNNRYSGNLVVKEDIYKNSTNRVEEVTYEYGATFTDGNGKLANLQVITSENHYRVSGEITENTLPTYTITSTYDDWGNLLTRIDNSRNLNESWTYHGQSTLRFKNLVDTKTTDNVDPNTSSTMETQTSYTYNDTIGKPTLITVTSGPLVNGTMSVQKTVETSFTYDSNQNGHSNLVSRIDDVTGAGIETDYTYESSLDAFLITKTIVDGQTVHGPSSDTLAPITTFYKYDTATGLKTWEIDPRGYLTWYDYDELNRVTQVILPADDDTPITSYPSSLTKPSISTHPSRRYIFDDTPDTNGYNYCDYYNENHQHTKFYFDGLGRLVIIDKDPDHNHYTSGIQTTYAYDNRGRIETVTDPKGNDTNYSYDDLNRVTQVEFPKSNSTDTTNPTAHLEYDDVTNTVTITDENSHVTTEQSDWANRLKTATQHCIYEPNTQDDTYVWEFKYDSLGNKVWQGDPKNYANNTYNPTTQIYNSLGLLAETDLPSTELEEQGTPVSPELSYTYDNLGHKTTVTDARGNITTYTYNNQGLVATMAVTSHDHINLTGGNPTEMTATTKYYYDANGNKILVIDPNGNEWHYTYSARGWLLSEEDPQENITRYRYDPLGNKIAVIDPRNDSTIDNIWYTISTSGGEVTGVTVGVPLGTDKTYTTWYVYNNLNQLVRTVLPKNTNPPSNPYSQSATGYPFTETTYDKNGNKLTETDANEVETEYTYSPRNYLATVSINNTMKTKYTYDAKGNKTKAENVADTDNTFNNVTEYSYDSLNRLRKVTQNSSIQAQYNYDAVGNKTEVIDGRGHSTSYNYNALSWLLSVTDPLTNKTKYQYDQNGNQVEVITPNNLTTANDYDELNRLYQTTDSLSQTTKFCYDLNGNRYKMVDRRGSTWTYQYYDNNLLQQLGIVNGSSSYQVAYTYDAAGNRTEVEDNGNTVLYDVNELNQVTETDRTFDSETYTTKYQYNNNGQLTGLHYPGAGTNDWLNYSYNSLNQLATVTGFTNTNGITYKADGALASMAYSNGVTNTYTYDNNRRLSELAVSHSSTGILDLGYTYDNNSNITQITDNNDSTKNKLYEYDNKNQLTKATIPTEAYLENTAATGDYYLKTADYIGAGVLGTQPSGLIKLDYLASSVAIDFGVTTPGIKKITLEPDSSYQTHRITGQTIDLYTSNNNSTYTLVSRNNWTFDKDSNGKATITLTNSVSARYLKLHVKFDDLDGDGEAVDTNSQFLNTLASMLRVYMETSTKEESYEYDEAGNRTLRTVKLVLTNDFHSYYYTNSDRLKKDGVYGYEYDVAGNLVKKGNTFTDSNDTLTFTTSGQGVEYWEFAYDLLNRLIEVDKNGTSGMETVAQYGYSPDGLRQVKTAGGYTTHYVFEGTEPIFEKKMSASNHETVSYIRSYVYALGKHIARVDGVIGDTNADKYWYVTDHQGSVRVVTDDTGATVWSADYESWGKQVGKNVGTGFQEDEFAYTGKGLDGDTGLYYYNARWYDSATGRFISEDPAMDPNNPNLYAGCRNNPVNVTDPTGLSTVVDNNGKLIDHQDDGDDTTYRQDTDGTWYVTTTIHTPPAGRSQTYYVWWESTHRYSAAFWNKNGGIPNATATTNTALIQLVIDPTTGESTWVTSSNYFEDYIAAALSYDETAENPPTGTEPTLNEVVSYIVQKCKDMGIPPQIGLATAWKESDMNQFKANGNPVSNKNYINDKLSSTDWGMMQINDKEWAGSFDFNKLKSDWRYNVDCGLVVLKDAYNTAYKQGKRGDDLIRATYCIYNAGPSGINRYQNTTNPDSRDTGYWNIYNNSSWNNK